MRTRKAQSRDAKAIHQLIDSFTHDGTLLPRSCSEICENIGTFTVVESEAGQFIGCAALHVYGPHLAEVRSIVVRQTSQDTEEAACSFNPSCAKSNSAAFNASASSPAFQPSSNTSASGSRNTSYSETKS